MIRFILFPDGKWIAKAKMSFVSDLAIRAQKIFDENIELHDFLDHCIWKDVSPIFELTSPENKIVLQYHHEELSVLQIRDNETGEYLPATHEINQYSSMYHMTQDQIYPSINDYLKEAESDETEEFEGWVLTFDDGHIVKLKTKWYIGQHRALEDFSRIDYIISCIMNDTLDDMIARLDDTDFKASVYGKLSVFRKWYFRKLKYIEKVNKGFAIAGDRKTFVLEHKGSPDFHIIMKSLKYGPKDALDQYINKQITTLSGALNFYDRISQC